MDSVQPRDCVTFEADTLGDVSGLWVHPADWSSEAIVHLHGGWFNFGSAKAYRYLVGHILLRKRARGRLSRTIGLLLNTYFRRPRTMCWHVTKDLPRGTFTGLLLRETFGGGNLVLVLAWRVTGEAASINATLVGVALLSPVTELTLSGATYETRAEADPLFNRPQVAELVHSYLVPSSTVVAEKRAICVSEVV